MTKFYQKLESRQKKLSAERLRQLLHYNPVTGRFTWLERRGGLPPSSEAGCVKANSYRWIGIDGAVYPAHRLAWLYMTDLWPTKCIDHKNLDKSDNRIANLREATHSQNLANTYFAVRNTSGRKGVCWHKVARKWYAQISSPTGKIYLGVFDSKESAAAAYTKAAIEMFGEYARLPPQDDRRAA